MAQVVLIRHGETEWSAAGRHTSYSEPPLTRRGEEQARRLGKLLGGVAFTAVLCSPRQRARRTAELAGLTVSAVVEDLAEWNYGEYEGATTAEIRLERPGWTLWRDGCPGGESPEQVQARIDHLLSGVRSLAGQGDVALIGHAHSMRVVAARWLGLPAAGGALFRLDVGRLSILGYEREQPVLLRWNSPT